MIDEARWLILVSFERKSVLVVPFGVQVTGYFIYGLNLKKNVFDQFLIWSNLKKFHFFMFNITN